LQPLLLAFDQCASLLDRYRFALEVLQPFFEVVLLDFLLLLRALSALRFELQVAQIFPGAMGKLFLAPAGFLAL
jgi:hypothetical protein